MLMKKEDVQPQEKEEEELEEELPSKPVPKKSLFEVNISSAFSLYQIVPYDTYWCWGSVTFWCGSGSGSADPYL